jgi:hypothetical protein
MTIFDNRKLNGTRGIGPHRPRLVASLLERLDVATLSFARRRPRGPPGAG